LKPKVDGVLKIADKGDESVQVKLRQPCSFEEEIEARPKSIARTGDKSQWLLEAYGRHDGERGHIRRTPNQAEKRRNLRERLE
jgi:hypothetical protein